MNPDLSKMPLCDQDWDAMEPLGDGRRLCARCRHPVTDFRGMTKEEITLVHLMSDERVCGVYSPGHLAPVDAAAPSRFRSGLVTLTLGASLLAARAEAQTATHVAIEQAQLPRAAAPPAGGAESAGQPAERRLDRDAARDTVVIRGTVRDDRTRQPLRDAAVLVEGHGVRVTTDSAGGFTLRFAGEAREVTLRVARIGYESRAVRVQVGRGETVDVNIRTRPVVLGLGFVVRTAEQSRREELRRVGYSATLIEGSR